MLRIQTYLGYAASLSVGGQMCSVTSSLPTVQPDTLHVRCDPKHILGELTYRHKKREMTEAEFIHGR